MSRVVLLLLAAVITLQEANATPPAVCKERSGPKHCYVKSYDNSVTRYEYNWEAKDCKPVNWSKACKIPVASNNFKDYDSCYKGCHKNK